MLKANFLTDARAWLLSELREYGHKPSATAALDDVARLVFNVVWRTIQPAPRAVHMSTRLRARLASPTLDAEIRVAIDEIARLSVRGESLRPFQTERVDRVSPHDYLLNDWFIHHLHVGSLHARRSSRTPRQGHFVGGRDELLFAYVAADAIYMIDLLDHGSFADQSLIQTLHEEWPHVLEPYRARGIDGGNGVTSDERRMGRERLLLLTTTEDGTVYFPPGGGSSTARISSEVVFRADRFLDGVLDIEGLTRAAERTLRDRIEEHVGFHPGELDLKFQIGDAGRVMLVECDTLIGLVTEFSLMASGAFRRDDAAVGKRPVGATRRSMAGSLTLAT